MDHREYRNAAARHLTTCKRLLDDLSAQKQENKQQILLNIYYLSGYIIETSLSFAFFSHIGHKGHVEQCEHYANGFKTHDFNAKVRFISKFNGDLSSLPFISIKHTDKNLQHLYNSWSTDYRYSYNDKVASNHLDEKLVERYLDSVSAVFKTIIQRF